MDFIVSVFGLNWHWCCLGPNEMLPKINNVWENENSSLWSLKCCWEWTNGIWSVNNEFYGLNCLYIKWIVYTSRYSQSINKIRKQKPTIHTNELSFSTGKKFFRIQPNNCVIILAAYLIAGLIQREIMTCDY